MHKENRESYAARAMHNTMGVQPALGQLYDRTYSNELASKRADDNDTDVPGDFEHIEELVAETKSE